MAYKLERASSRFLELEVDGEILKIAIGGMALYRRVLEAQSKLRDIQTKIEILKENGKEITEELVEYLGQTVIYMFEVSFGKENTDKILAFYDGNYDEMLMKVYPFFLNEFVPALKGGAKADSREYAKRLAGVS